MALPYGNIYKNCLYLGHTVELKRKIFATCKIKTEEHAGGMPRHAWHDKSAGLEEELKLRGFPGDGKYTHTNGQTHKPTDKNTNQRTKPPTPNPPPPGGWWS